MRLKEAILKSLEAINKPVSYSEVYNYIVDKKYVDFTSSKTPVATVSASLGDFIRNGDSRVSRIKQDGSTYLYFLTKNEENISIDILSKEIKPKATKVIKVDKTNTYDEKDLHKLLSTYLKSISIYSKTIPHEQSNSKDNNQIWTHPDMIGVKFLNLQTKASQNILKYINRADTFKVSSYELKKEINNDSELKKAFFQALSNSSWANYGYLVAFEFSSNLLDEIERLNQSFGIGVIKLNANPYESKVLFPAKFNNLDFKTIDKLCKINKTFSAFFEQVEKLMIAEERFSGLTEKELHEFCDDYFVNDTDIEEYCREYHIPTE